MCPSCVPPVSFFPSCSRGSSAKCVSSARCSRDYRRRCCQTCTTVMVNHTLHLVWSPYSRHSCSLGFFKGIILYFLWKFRNSHFLIKIKYLHSGAWISIVAASSVFFYRLKICTLFFNVHRTALSSSHRIRTCSGTYPPRFSGLLCRKNAERTQYRPTIISTTVAPSSPILHRICSQTRRKIFVNFCLILFANPNITNQPTST